MDKRKQLLAAAAAGLASLAAYAQGAPSQADMQRGMDLMQKQMAVMSPELVEKAKALSPEIKQFLARVAMRHERRSDTLTLVQVMQEILAEHQSIGAAIATDNGPMAADAARLHEHLAIGTAMRQACQRPCHALLHLRGGNRQAGYSQYPTHFVLPRLFNGLMALRRGVLRHSAVRSGTAESR